MDLAQKLVGKKVNGHSIEKALMLTDHAGYALILNGLPDQATLISFAAAEQLANGELLIWKN